MAYAEDLKSSAGQLACGFESRPRHSRPRVKKDDLVGGIHRCGLASLGIPNQTSASGMGLSSVMF